MSDTAFEATTGVAIIGMDGRFPGAQNLEAYWQNLRNGVGAVTDIPEADLLRAGVHPSVLESPGYIRRAAILEDIDLFDAEFFGFTDEEAALLDPQHRLFLEACWGALEGAGYDAERSGGRAGVFAGQGPSSYLMQNLISNPALVRQYAGTSFVEFSDGKDYLATRVSYALDLKGPSVTVQTACSTGLTAVALASQSLLQYQCDMALAGAVSLRVPMAAGYYYQEGSIYSSDGTCRPLDAGATGTVPGAGVGVVLLKRLEDALADGDRIWAVVRGASIYNHGASRARYTHPCADSQTEAAAEAMALAGAEPDTISYVEAHGTGMLLGDSIELEGLTRAYRSPNRQRDCLIGSVKGNIGYAGVAAGMSGLLKTVLALHHREIPPTLHVQRPNPVLTRSDSPFRVSTELTPWPRSTAPRRASVNAFGLGGTSAHLVLEEAPEIRSDPARSDWHLIPLSARTPSALAALRNQLASCLTGDMDHSLADIAYTLQVGRRSFAHRFAVVCRTREQVVAALLQQAGQGPSESPATWAGVGDARQTERVTWLIPLADARAIAAARELFQTEPLFRSEVDAASAVVQQAVGPYDLWQGWSREDDVAQSLQSFVIGYALGRVFARLGLYPDHVVGFAAGQHAAACLADLISVTDAVGGLASRRPLPAEMAAATNPHRTVEDPVLVLGALHCTGLTPPGPRWFAALPEAGIPAAARLRAILGRYWLAGREPDWASLYGGEKRLRVPLPGYPFQRQRYWVEPGNQAFIW